MFLWSVVAVNFNQPYYRVTESSGQVEIALELTDPLPIDVTVTVTETDQSAISESLILL